MMQKNWNGQWHGDMNRKLHEKNIKFLYSDIQKISGPCTSYKHILS